MTSPRLSSLRPSPLRSALWCAALGTALWGASPSHDALAGARPGVTAGVLDEALVQAEVDRPAAAAMLESAIASGDYAAQDLLLRVHAGEQRRLLGELEQARTWFKSVLTKTASGPEHTGADLGLLLTDSTGKPVDATTASLLEGPAASEALPTQNADRYLLLAAWAASTGNADLTREHTRTALQYAREDKSVFTRVRASLQALASGEQAATPGLVDVPIARASKIDAAAAAFDGGRKDEARQLAQEVLAAPPSAEDALTATYLLRALDAGTVVNSNKVGVLLPLSGKYGAIGSRIRAAIELGYRDAARGRTLVFADAGADATSATEALERLALEEGVVAVLGPLRSDLGPELAPIAQALRVPLISLSPVDGLTDDRSWVFQAMVTPDQLVDGLLDYTVKTRGITSYAVFAPDDTYGHTSADAFSAGVSARGGKVTVTRFYDPEATDLVPDAQALGRKDYETRKSELWQLQREAKEAGGDPSKVVLPPVTDFQAIFLPDKASRVPLAAAGLAYEEFPIGEFQTTKDGATLPLLGLSSWNNHSIVTAGGPYARSSVFVDVYLPTDANGLAFSNLFRQETGKDPSPLEASAYDAGRLLSAAALSDANGRAAFRDALLAAAVRDPVTGATGFDQEQRTALHQVRVLTITKDGIYPIDAVPTEDAPPR
jgi:branched-chain amino acid transport system substrate-binding protein